MTATASPYWLGLDPGTQSEEVVDTLDELERSVPSGMFESMRVLSRADEPQKLFHHLWTTCEFLARHLCALCNAVYINGNVEDDKLDKEIAKLLDSPELQNDKKYAWLAATIAAQQKGILSNRPASTVQARQWLWRAEDPVEVAKELVRPIELQ